MKLKSIFSSIILIFSLLLLTINVALGATQYGLTISVKGDGATTPLVGTNLYDEGSIVDVSAIPDEGSSFSHWELDGGFYSLENSVSVTVDVDHELIAVFCGPLNWQRTFGDASFDNGYDVVFQDGFRYVAGITTGSDWDVFLNKYNSDGDLMWGQQHLGSDGEDNTANSLVVVGDGFVTLGRTDRNSNVDYYLLKMGSDGAFSWDVAIGGSSFESGTDLVSVTGGGFVLTGITESFGDGARDVYLVKTDDSGVVEWENTFGGVNNDEAHSIIECSDMGFLVAGFTESFTADRQIYLIKTDSNGIPEWETQIGDAGYTAIATDVLELPDGYFVLGSMASSSGDQDIYLAKIDFLGNVEWENTYGGAFADCGNSIIQLSNGKYAVAGYTYQETDQDTIIIIVDEDGNQLASATYGGTKYESASAIAETEDGYFVTTYTNSLTGNYDAYMLDIPDLVPEGIFTITTEGLGTTSPPVGEYAYSMGQRVIVNAFPATEWEFSHWLLDGENAGSNLFIDVVVDGDHTIAAVFTPYPELEIQIQGQGTTNLAAGIHKYPTDSMVIVEATATQYSEFNHWLLDDQNIGSQNPTSVLMDQNHVLTAVFVNLGDYLVTAQEIGDGVILIDNAVQNLPFSEQIAAGTVLNLRAYPEALQVFSHWEVNGVNMGTNPELSVTVDAEKSIVAVFVDDTDSWPMWGYNFDNSPVTDYEPITDPVTLWDQNVDGSARASVKDGKVYVGANTIYCLNENTGEIIWQYADGYGYRQPFLAYGNVYCTSLGGDVVCLNENSGELVWSFDSIPTWGSAVVHDGKVFFSVISGGNIKALDAFTGEFLWTTQLTPGTPEQRSTPVYSDNKLYLSTGMYVTCVDAETGVEIWRQEQRRITQSPSLSINGDRFYTGNGTYISCNNLADGNRIWEYEIDAILTSSPVVYNGKVYAASVLGTLYCLDSNTGSLEWNVVFNELMQSGPIFADGVLYQTSSDEANDDGKLYSVDPISGEINWEMVFAKGIIAQPCLHGSKIFVGTSYNQMSCVTFDVSKTAEELVSELRDYIVGLPNDAFSKKADNQKKSLSNQLSAVQNQISEAEYVGAINHLQAIWSKMDGIGKDWITDPEIQGILSLKFQQIIKELITLL